MCGQAYEKLQRRFGFKPTRYQPEPRYNIAPGQEMPVLVKHVDMAHANMEHANMELVPMRWGLIPSWAKDEKIGYKMINARSETVREKPSFRGPFRTKRCLVPADAYYEWMKVPGSTRKRPFRFSLKNDELFGFAGIWDVWTKPDGTRVRSFSIITTEANDIARPIHHRMPAIIHRKDENMWLDCSINDAGQLTSLLGPYPSSEMDFYEVSTVVNSPRNDSPLCMTRIDN